MLSDRRVYQLVIEGLNTLNARDKKSSMLGDYSASIIQEKKNSRDQPKFLHKHSIWIVDQELHAVIDITLKMGTQASIKSVRVALVL